MRLRLILAAVLLSACQLALPGKTPEAASVNPITTGQISVTALDAPPAGDAAPLPETQPVAAPEQPAVEAEAASPAPPRRRGNPRPN